MGEKRYHLYKSEEQEDCLYLEMNDLSEAAVQIWQDAEGEKRTFVRIKMTRPEWEKILDEYKHIQTIQEANKRVEI